MNIGINHLDNAVTVALSVHPVVDLYYLSVSELLIVLVRTFNIGLLILEIARIVIRTALEIVQVLAYQIVKETHRYNVLLISIGTYPLKDVKIATPIVLLVMGLHRKTVLEIKIELIALAHNIGIPNKDNVLIVLISALNVLGLY